MKNNIINLLNLTKKYNTKEGEIDAIKEITFGVKKGDIIAILGPSGCGKSTLLSIIAGLDKKSSGTVCINDNLVKSYMLQQDALFNHLTVYKNAILGLKIQNKLDREHLDENNEVLESNNASDFYKIKEFKNKYPKSLSGGMKQRVA